MLRRKIPLPHAGEGGEHGEPGEGQRSGEKAAGTTSMFS